MAVQKEIKIKSFKNYFLKKDLEITVQCNLNEQKKNQLTEMMMNST